MRRNRAVDVVVAIVAVGLVAASFAPWETYVSMSSEQRFSTEQLDATPRFGMYAALVASVALAAVMLVSLGTAGRGRRTTGTAAAPA